MTIAPDTAVDAPTSTALEIRDLRVAYRPAHQLIEVVHGVTLSVSRGRTLALVGQSGSGKSTIALAAAGLLPKRGEVTGGSIALASRDVTGFADRDWRPLRGSEIGFVPQDPLSSLDPLQTIGSRLAAELKRHGVPRGERAARAADLLARVGIVDAAHKLRLRPHELSGGQLQRVLIAIAISGSPQLLIADEPTTALDANIRTEIIALLDELRRESGMGIIFVTHDLAMLSSIADRVNVFRTGEIVESGEADRLFRSPEHPYTRVLLDAVPKIPWPLPKEVQS
jgi:ABC-type dipeptide/oligopeptide/nickel transport system ATPase component